MAATNANIVPVKGRIYRFYFPWYKSDGKLLASATTTASQISKDGGNFTTVDDGNPNQVETSGVYFIDLTAAEMQADCIVYKATASDADSCVVTIPIYTQSTTSKIPVDLQTMGQTTVTTYSPIDAAVTQLALSAGLILPGTVYASNSTNTYFESESFTEATTDHFKGRSVLWTSGAMIGQASSITGYAFVATPSRGGFTIAQVTETVPAGTTFIIV